MPVIAARVCACACSCSSCWPPRPSLLHRASYKAGDTAVLSFQNPFPSARALLVCGSLAGTTHTFVAQVGGPGRAGQATPICPPKAPCGWPMHVHAR